MSVCGHLGGDHFAVARWELISPKKNIAGLKTPAKMHIAAVASRDRPEISGKPCEVVGRRADTRCARRVLKAEDCEYAPRWIEDRVLVRITAGDAPPSSGNRIAAGGAENLIVCVEGRFRIR